MTATETNPHHHVAPGLPPGRDSTLLVDQFLPRYDFVVVHASVFAAPPDACYAAARGLDLLRDPAIRMLLGLRSFPQRLADRLPGRRAASGEDAPQRTFRLDDMLGPPMNWVLLGEEPDVQIVLGQIGRPWKPVGASEGPPVEAAEFASFDRPEFAKIAFSLRVQPYGYTSSILTMETRVALTDPRSLRRFTRYWRVVGPFVRSIDRMTLRRLAAELRRSTPTDAPTRA